MWRGGGGGGGRCAHYDDLCLETFFASFLVTVNK